jgi:hypothetical protein
MARLTAVRRAVNWRASSPEFSASAAFRVTLGINLETL